VELLTSVGGEVDEVCDFVQVVGCQDIECGRGGDVLSESGGVLAECGTLPVLD
jgi:hypothetical protein